MPQTRADHNVPASALAVPALPLTFPLCFERGPMWPRNVGPRSVPVLRGASVVGVKFGETGSPSLTRIHGTARNPTRGALMSAAPIPLAIAGTGYGLIGLLVIVLLIVLIMRLI
jgi:hypothetical protein